MSKSKNLTAHGEVSVVEVAEFTRAFAQLIHEGESIVRALSQLYATQKNGRLQAAIGSVNRAVQEGATLSQAMSEFGDVFDNAYLDAVRLGEVNGNLEQSLHGLTRLDDYLNFEQAMAFLGTSKPTLYRLLSTKVLSGLKVGRQWRFRKDDLIAYMERKPAAAQNINSDVLDTELRALQVLADEPDTLIPDAQVDKEAKIDALVNVIIVGALKSGASDLHLESARLDETDCVLLRHRIDGVLHEVRRLPKSLATAIFERFKQVAALNVEERALPQDGRVLLNFREQKFDLRVSFAPINRGASLVIRILLPQSLLKNDLGLNEAGWQQLRGWMERPNGLLIVAGVTGSGKTTTAYNLLQSSMAPETKTFTIEDPVEYDLDYATQMYVNARAGLTFATATRAILRQDPDVIFIGEIRDHETLALACHAAMTGHLVISTVSANDAAGALHFLLGLDVAPQVLSTALVGVTSQTLARRLCDHCSQDSELTATEIQTLHEVFDVEIPAASTCRRAAGCDKCRRSGFRGRVGIFEIVANNTNITLCLRENPSVETLRQTLRAQEARSQADAAVAHILNGNTSTEEILRVLLGTHAPNPL